MKAIVVGAGGMAGSAFIRELPRLDCECIAVTRENYDRMAGSEADILINANGNSAKYLARRDPAGEIERSVTSVMRTCCDFHYDKYVLLSSADVYTRCDDPTANTEETVIRPEAISIYALCKFMAECTARNQCADLLVLRCGGLIGPGLRKNPVYDLLTGAGLFVHPDSRFGFLSTRELAHIVDALIRCDAEGVVNACGHGLVSIREAMEITNRRDAQAPADARPIRYEINHDKLSAVHEPSDSAATVRAFVAWWRESEAR